MKTINPNDIVGLVFSGLQVIKYSHHQPHTNNSRKHFYNCVCCCGKETVVERYRLISGNTKSCGCINSRRTNFVGKRFGRLTVLERTGDKFGKSKASIYLCVCDCGKHKKVSSNHLSMGLTKSCGCWNSEFHAKNFLGDKNPKWRGGNPKDYPAEFNRSLKERIRNRDDRTCQYPECTYTDIGKPKKLDVHHINGNKDDCRDTNLISLCQKHHSEIEGKNSRYFSELFNFITESYI